MWLVLFLCHGVQCFDCVPSREMHVLSGDKKSAASQETAAKRMSKLEEQRRLLEKNLDYMYPWRQNKPTSTGMSFKQHKAVKFTTATEKACKPGSDPAVSPLLSVGVSDLEYSMEPRNFSRGLSKPLLRAAPIVATPLDSAENVDVPVDTDNLAQIWTTGGTAISTQEETKMQTFYDELVSVLLQFCIVI